MTIGNARGGVLGDTLASVLKKTGHNVWREFYVNDAGNQVDKFGRSIEARYLQILHGEDKVEFPEDGYHGQDIVEMAQRIYTVTETSIRTLLLLNVKRFLQNSAFPSISN